MSIDVERDGGTAIVTVNRPDALNAVDLEHAETLRETLEELAADEQTRVVVLTGAGEKSFIAGADIKYMQELGVLEARRWGELGHACGRLLETMPKPTIAAINGYALGGGLELALACDLRVAASTAKLGQPEINLGILPGWGGSIRLARTTTLGFAKALIFTGRSIDAAEALQHGLVNAVWEPAELMAKTRELAEGLAAKSGLALAYAKEALNQALQGDHRVNLELEARLFAMMFSSEDQKEGMAAFVEKREPRFTGR
jgi:enoyl-CoA hydratase